MLPCAQEGFAPAAFKSSRGARAEAKAQSVDDFLDEDELAVRNKAKLQVGAFIGLS